MRDEYKRANLPLTESFLHHHQQPLLLFRFLLNSENQRKISGSPSTVTMRLQSVFIMAPFLVAIASAAPVAQGTAPGTFAVAGPEPDCYFPHGEDSHEMICTYTSDEPGRYPVITSNIPDSCGPDPEDGADIVCYLPGKLNIFLKSCPLYSL